MGCVAECKKRIEINKRVLANIFELANTLLLYSIMTKLNIKCYV